MMKYKYVPVFRSRQQENVVLTEFDFGDYMMPMIEVIKEKDRVNNKDESEKIYKDLIESVNTKKILVDLPIYLSPTPSTADEVIKFFRNTISRLDKRISFYSSLNTISAKVIPVVSSLAQETGEIDTVKTQFNSLKNYFSSIAFRIFFNGFEHSMTELRGCSMRDADIIIYDLDTIPVTNPIIKKHSRAIHESFPNNFTIIIRSAINTDIQNIRLAHGEVIGEADNSLLELYNNSNYGFSAFGDYVGIKKDEISSGGTISPGFIFYDPIDNVYYGFKGNAKNLSEFETTIVPSVLDSDVVSNIERTKEEFLINNAGYETLKNIRDNRESGKNQAKFKKISMQHYLHCIKTKVNLGELN
ncbi:MAG: hypothetical protein KGZ58_07675 [Ignavibacteriales bacterium]|nr:hypothetical protein [Ignavibacteriales bacterium]